MNEEIRNLEPNKIWNNFADLNAVPRASKKEELVIAFIVAFGKKLDLETNAVSASPTSLSKVSLSKRLETDSSSSRFPSRMGRHPMI